MLGTANTIIESTGFLAKPLSFHSDTAPVTFKAECEVLREWLTETAGGFTGEINARFHFQGGTVRKIETITSGTIFKK